MTAAQFLGVEPNASADECKRAFHDLARRFHPDMGAEADPEVFDKVCKAYREILLTPIVCTACGGKGKVSTGSGFRIAWARCAPCEGKGKVQRI